MNNCSYVILLYALEIFLSTILKKVLRHFKKNIGTLLKKILEIKEGCVTIPQSLKFYFKISFKTADKYFMLFKHWSKVFPVEPISIILAYFPVC